MPNDPRPGARGGPPAPLRDLLHDFLSATEAARAAYDAAQAAGATTAAELALALAGDGSRPLVPAPDDVGNPARPRRPNKPHLKVWAAAASDGAGRWRFLGYVRARGLASAEQRARRSWRDVPGQRLRLVCCGVRPARACQLGAHFAAARGG